MFHCQREKEKREKKRVFGWMEWDENKLKASLFKYSISLIIKQEEVETLISIHNWFFLEIRGGECK